MVSETRHLAEKKLVILLPEQIIIRIFATRILLAATVCEDGAVFYLKKVDTFLIHF